VTAPLPDVPLSEILEAARERGFLGPGPVADQLRHAAELARLLDVPPGPWLDLGSGGGLPGLVLARAWPTTAGALLDAGTRRTAFLAEATTRLGMADRVTVVTGRAEEVAREPVHRGRYSVVVARSFGSPAVTAECAVGFLQEGGHLAVSEPPDSDPATRWPSEGLAQLAFEGPEIRRGDGASVAILTKTAPTSDRWPRRTGIPTKRPLW
jgi:16S rRNA (guanine527-N7)-methyltransferase